MKFAIFGDIHGNIEALKAAYEAAQAAGAEKIYHLGDLGGYSPFVNEVVDFLIEHNIEGVQGNYDETVAHEREHCGCKYEDPVQEEMANKSFEWTKKHASVETKEYLRMLPSPNTSLPRGKRFCCSMPRHRRTTCTGTRTGRTSFIERWQEKLTQIS